jgi:SAM-dependent methyltransferase
MTRITSDTIVDLLDASFTAAAVGAALELGLFWRLDGRPEQASDIAEAFGIPGTRCGYWLQLLVNAGLLEERPDGFVSSRDARTAITETFSRDTWAFLAGEARERFPALTDLSLTIRGATTTPGVRPRPDYLQVMAADPTRAARFTRMLYELHQALAEEIAGRVDATGVTRLMDLGGGSGVVSIALARRHPSLAAVVLDIANVCNAGHTIAAANGVHDRVTYQPIDLLTDELPAGFDLAVMCDVGLYSEDLFRRIASALTARGRFIIVDLFAPAPGVAPHTRVHWALERSLADPAFRFPTADDIERLLTATGFRPCSRGTMRSGETGDGQWTEPMTILEAERT